MKPFDPWEQLGIAPTDDGREVKRAYARVLKRIDVDADPDAFIRLRTAMEMALAWGSRAPLLQADAEEAPWTDVGSDEMPPEGEGEGAFDAAACEPLDFHLCPVRGNSGDDGLDALRAELERLLFGEALPDPARVQAVGEQILSHAALASVDCLVEVEQWLSESIASAIPRSDPLIEPAMARFGWRNAGRGWSRSWALEQVLQRRSDLAFLDQCGRSYAQHRAALDELRGPPRRRLSPFKLGLAGQVKDFLRLVETEHPTIEHDLDPASLAWWRHYLAGPRLPVDFWPAIIGAPIVLSFGLSLLWMAREGETPSLLILYPLVLLATLVALFADAVLRARAGQRAAAFPEDGRLDDLWPLALVLAAPLAAALSPAARWATLLSSGAAVAVLVLTLGRLWIVRPRRVGESRYFLPLLAALLSIAIVIRLPLEAALRMLAPLAGLCWVGVECSVAVERRLLAVPTATRSFAAGALLLELGTVALLLNHGFAPPDPPLWLLAIVPVAVIAGQLGAPLGVQPRWSNIFVRIAWVVVIVSSNLGSASFVWLYVAGSLVALACAALRAAATLRADWR